METENSSTLEQEIADIERRLAEKKAAKTALEQGRQETTTFSGSDSDKELLGEVVQEKITEHLPAAPSSVSAEAELNQDQILPPLVQEPPAYLDEDLKGRVQELVNLAFEQTPSRAIKETVKTNNAALINAFHSVLVDQLYELLIERGKLKKIN